MARRDDKKQVDNRKNKAGVDDTLEKIDKIKWSCAGHLRGMENERWAKKSTGWTDEKNLGGDQKEDGGMILRVHKLRQGCQEQRTV